MGLLDQATGPALALLERIRCAVSDAAQHAKGAQEAATGTARALAFQYGVPPAPGGALPPRSMLALPIVLEGSITERLTLDIREGHGRHIYAGYVANIGDDALKVAWLGYDGQTSGLFTIPPAASVQIPCILRGVLIEPVGGGVAVYQASFS